VRGDELAEQDETFQVQLANPVGAVLDDDLAVVTIFDDDALPSASISDSHLCESSGSRMPFLVRLSAPAGYTITLEFSTSDGTASTADYTPNAGALTIPAGSTRSKVRVDVLDDNILEDDETLTVALSAPQGVSLSRDLATGTILDDEGLGAPGDTNGDCSFDASDLSRTIRKLTDPPFVVPGNADCNGNGLISTPDLTCILRARVFGR
jgi:chitinase